MRLSRRISFFDQMATMTSGGVPLRRTLDRAGTRWRDPEIAALKHSLDNGSGAAEAFEAARFSAFEIKVIAAGERSGQLDESFRQLAAYWKTENELVGAMWKQMAYPIIVLNLTAIVGPLPKIFTQSVFAYIVSVIWQLGVLYGGAFLALELIKATWRSESGQNFWLRVPLVGRFWRSTYAYRWIVTLRMELNAGFSFSQSVADAWEATRFSSRHQRAAEGRDGIQRGESLSALVASWHELPADWCDYFETAQESGKINETLEYVEGHALAEWKRAQERLADWAPKLLYLALILYAGFQVFSMAFETYNKVGAALDSVMP